MALIPQSELLQLKSASDVLAVSQSAVLDQERQAVAGAINTAANTGATFVLVNRKLSEEIIAELNSKGYIVRHDSARARATDQATIYWNPDDLAPS
jgi:hypothetical protein